MGIHPVALVRRFFTWLVLFGAIVAAAFNVWLAVNGSWPGWVAAILLVLLAAKCFHALWRNPERRQSR